MMRVAGGKVGRDLGALDPERPARYSDAHARAASRSVEDRALVQHVAPGQDASALARRREKSGGAVAIGDDQVGHGGPWWAGGRSSVNPGPFTASGSGRSGQPRPAGVKL